MNEREERQREQKATQVKRQAWASSSTEDDRRNKRYSRTVKIGGTVLVRDYHARRWLGERIDYREGVESPWQYMREALSEEFASDEVRVEIGCADGFFPARTEDRDAGWSYHLQPYVTRRFAADKPSQIPSENECLEALGGRDVVGARIQHAVEAGLAKAEKIEAACERARIADIIVDEYAKRVDERAKRAVRYEQRLAALKAEYETERDVQAVQLLEELGDDVGLDFEDGYEPDERSVAAAKAKLPERVARLGAPHTRSRFLPSSDDTACVSLDEVE